ELLDRWHAKTDMRVSVMLPDLLGVINQVQREAWGDFEPYVHPNLERLRYRVQADDISIKCRALLQVVNRKRDMVKHGLLPFLRRAVKRCSQHYQSDKSIKS